MTKYLAQGENGEAEIVISVYQRGALHMCRTLHVLTVRFLNDITMKMTRREKPDGIREFDKKPIWKLTKRQVRLLIEKEQEIRCDYLLYCAPSPQVCDLFFAEKYMTAETSLLKGKTA